MNKIETELQRATGVRPKPKEKRAAYLDRLADEADKLPDAKFEKLSSAAAKWVNDVNEAAEAAKERGVDFDAGEYDFDDGDASENDETKEDGASTDEVKQQPAIKLTDENEKEEEDVAQKKGKAAPKKAAAKTSAKAPARPAKEPAKKIAAKSAKAKANGRGTTRPRVDQAAKIKLLVKENPKRGEKSKKAFALYRDGMTVGDFLKKGGTPADISWDTRHNFIKLV